MVGFRPVIRPPGASICGCSSTPFAPPRGHWNDFSGRPGTGCAPVTSWILVKKLFTAFTPSRVTDLTWVNCVAGANRNEDASGGDHSVTVAPKSPFMGQRKGFGYATRFNGSSGRCGDRGYEPGLCGNPAFNLQRSGPGHDDQGQQDQHPE